MDVKHHVYFHFDFDECVSLVCATRPSLSSIGSSHTHHSDFSPTVLNYQRVLVCVDVLNTAFQHACMRVCVCVCYCFICIVLSFFFLV